MARRHNATGRSSGEGRYVRLPHYVLECPAFLSLQPADVRLYVELERRYNGSNNGKIHLSVREAAEKIQGSTATASRALARLADRGFIAPMVKGAFSLKTRHATEWRLLIYPHGSEAVAPKAFMRWTPPPVERPAAELSEEEKKQNAVRVVQLLVSVVKPFGARGATERSEIGPDGARGETVEGDKQASQFHHAHTYSLPDTVSPLASRPLTRGREGRQAEVPQHPPSCLLAECDGHLCVECEVARRKGDGDGWERTGPPPIDKRH